MDGVQQSVPLFRAFGMVWSLFLLQNNEVFVSTSGQVKINPYPGSKVSVIPYTPGKGALRIVTVELNDNTLLIAGKNRRFGNSYPDYVDVLEFRKLSTDMLFKATGEIHGNAIVKPEDIYDVSTLSGSTNSSVEAYDNLVRLFQSFVKALK